MDPLSAAGSIIGILAAAGRVGEILRQVMSSAKDMPRLAVAVHSKVFSLRVILQSLQQLLLNLPSGPTGEAELIRVDQLIATLTDGVLAFAELEELVAPLEPASASQMPFLSRLKWARQENTLLRTLGRLQGFKGSISLMLNILQW